MYTYYKEQPLISNIRAKEREEIIKTVHKKNKTKHIKRVKWRNIANGLLENAEIRQIKICNTSLESQNKVNFCKCSSISVRIVLKDVEYIFVLKKKRNPYMVVVLNNKSYPSGFRKYNPT